MPLNRYSHFEIPGIVTVENREGDLPQVVVSNQYAEAGIFLLGAQVVRFKPRGEKDLLWLSPHSSFVEGKAIRGGVPICWPWFAANSSNKDLPNHGVVRTRSWNLISTAQLSDGRTRVELGIDSDEQSLVLWPHAFTLRLVVTVGPTLELELITTNTGADPFRYEEALHAYFAVSEVGVVRVEGFDGAPVLDRAHNDARSVQVGDITFPGEVDRILFSDAGKARISDPGFQRHIVVRQKNARAAITWNPGSIRAGKMADIAESWPTFVCVESANCADVPVVLLSGNSHRMVASYSLEK